MPRRGGQAGRDLEGQEVVHHEQLAVATRVPIGVADRVDPGGVDGAGHRHDDVPHGQVLAARTELHHLAAELVPHDDWLVGHEGLRGQRVGRVLGRQLVAQGELLGAVLQHMEVTAADPAGQHAGEGLAGLGNRIGQVVDGQLPVAHHRGSHGGRA